MIEFTNTLMIERPVNEVFDFISDFENMPKWNYYVVDVQNINEEPPQKGTTYNQVRKTDRQRFKITEFEQNRRVSIQTIPPTEDLKMRFIFVPIESGTMLIDEWKVGNGTFSPINWLAKRKMKSAVAENLQKLKELLEAGSVTLQDGRTESL
jgi:uncharacterized membrane protein